MHSAGRGVQLRGCSVTCSRGKCYKGKAHPPLPIQSPAHPSTRPPPPSNHLSIRPLPPTNHLPICPPAHHHPSNYLSICLSSPQRPITYLPFCPVAHHHPSNHLSIHLHTHYHPSNHLPICPPTQTTTHPITCPSATHPLPLIQSCPSTCPPSPIQLFVHPSTHHHPSNHVSIHSTTQPVTCSPTHSSPVIRLSIPSSHPSVHPSSIHRLPECPLCRP